MKNLNNYLRLIEVIALVGALLVAIIQLNNIQKANYGLTSLEVSRDLYSDKTYKQNPKIIELLHQGKPILKENGGPITDEELNNFLGLLEWMYSANEVGILNINIVNEMFSTDILVASENKEIRDFIKQARSNFNDREFFSGFEKLIVLLKK